MSELRLVLAGSKPTPFPTPTHTLPVPKVSLIPPKVILFHARGVPFTGADLVAWIALGFGLVLFGFVLGWALRRYTR